MSILVQEIMLKQTFFGVFNNECFPWIVLMKLGSDVAVKFSLCSNAWYGWSKYFQK